MIEYYFIQLLGLGLIKMQEVLSYDSIKYTIIIDFHVQMRYCSLISNLILSSYNFDLYVYYAFSYKDKCDASNDVCRNIGKLHKVFIVNCNNNKIKTSYFIFSLTLVELFHGTILFMVATQYKIPLNNTKQTNMYTWQIINVSES